VGKVFAGAASESGCVLGFRRNHFEPQMAQMKHANGLTTKSAKGAKKGAPRLELKNGGGLSLGQRVSGAVGSGVILPPARSFRSMAICYNGTNRTCFTP
jgi:hypothetical protein